MKRRRWLALGLLALGAGAMVALVLAVRPVLIPFLLALAIAYLIAPAVAALEGRGISRPRAILAVYAGLGLVGVALVLRVLPAAYAQLERLALAMPAYGQDVRLFLWQLQARSRDSGLPEGVRTGVEHLVGRLESRANAFLAAAVGNLPVYLEWGAYAALAPILAYYLLKDLELFNQGLQRALPRAWRGPVRELVRGVDRVCGGFVRGQLLVAAVVGALATVAAHLLGLRFSLLLGLWAALADLVPYVGPVAGAVPAVLAGLLISPLRALEVALAFALIQQLENAVLGPKVLGEQVGLHPVAVLFAVLAGGYLAGVAGMVLAVPVAGVARVVWVFACRRLAAPQG